jgi:predicted permease
VARNGRTGLGLVMGLHAIGVFHAPDALFMLVLLVSHSMPTAMQLGTVATLRKSGEAEVSALLFWQYMSCLVTLPLALTLQRHLL